MFFHVEDPPKTNFVYYGNVPTLESVFSRVIIWVAGSRTLSYKDVEIVSVSLTEHLLLAKSLAKTAFL